MDIEPIRLDTNLLNSALQVKMHQQGQAELQRHHAVLEQEKSSSNEDTNLRFIAEHGGPLQQLNAFNRIQGKNGMPTLPPEEYVHVQSQIKGFLNGEASMNESEKSKFAKQMLPILPRYAGEIMAAVQKKQAVDANADWAKQNGAISPGDDPSLQEAKASTLAASKEATNINLKATLDIPLHERKMDLLDQKIMERSATLNTLTDNMRDDTPLRAQIQTLSEGVLGKKIDQQLRLIDVTEKDPERREAMKRSLTDKNLTDPIVQQSMQAVQANLQKHTTQEIVLRDQLASTTNSEAKALTTSQLAATSLLKQANQSRLDWLQKPSKDNFAIMKQSEQAVLTMQQQLATHTNILKNQRNTLGERRLDETAAQHNVDNLMKAAAFVEGEAGAKGVVDPVTGAINYDKLMSNSARDLPTRIEGYKRMATLKEFARNKESLLHIASSLETQLKTERTEKGKLQDITKAIEADPRVQAGKDSDKGEIFQKEGRQFKWSGKGKDRKLILVE